MALADALAFTPGPGLMHPMNPPTLYAALTPAVRRPELQQVSAFGGTEKAADAHESSGAPEVLNWPGPPQPESQTQTQTHTQAPSGVTVSAAGSASDAPGFQASLGDILGHAGTLDALQVQRILDYQQRHGVRFGEADIALGMASSDEVAQALAHQFR